jgi:DNA polymerase-3 subunit epsilon
MNRESLPSLFVFDVETTGVDVTKDRVVQIGWLWRSGGAAVIDQGRRLIRPGIPIPEGAAKVHGIRDSDVRDAPAFCDVMASTLEGVMTRARAAGAWMVGYNAPSFDCPLVDAHFEAEGAPRLFGDDPRVVDPLAFIRRDYRHVGGRNLAKMYSIITRKPVPTGKAHDALGDCEMTAELTHALILAGSIPSTLSTALEVQRKLAADYAEEHERYGGWVYVDESGAFAIGKGKHVSRKLDDAPTSYLEWVLGLGDIPPAVAVLFRDVVESRRVGAGHAIR